MPHGTASDAPTPGAKLAAAAAAVATKAASMPPDGLAAAAVARPAAATVVKLEGEFLPGRQIMTPLSLAFPS